MPLYCHRSLPEVKSALAADIACVTYGRYLRDGTLGYLGIMNLYEVLGGNPAVYVDPQGLEVVAAVLDYAPGAAAAGAVAAGAVVVVAGAVTFKVGYELGQEIGAPAGGAVAKVYGAIAAFFAAKASLKAVKSLRKVAEEHIGQITPCPPDPDWNNDKWKHAMRALKNMAKQIRKLARSSPKKARQWQDVANQVKAKAIQAMNNSGTPIP